MPRTLIGILIKLIAVFLVAMIAILVKSMPVNLPNSELVFFRCLLAIPFVIGFTLYQHHGNLTETRQALTPKNVILHIRRSFFGLVSMVLIFASVRLAPLPIANALKELSPILTTLLATIFLGEKIRLIRTTGLILGALGVAVISFEAFRDGFHSLSANKTALGAFAALAAAFTIAMAQIQIRSMIGKEHPSAIVLFFFVMGTVTSLPFAPFTWAWPSGTQTWLWLAGIGCAGGLGQLAVTLAYRYADASTIAPFEYFSIPLMIIIGGVFFEEWPSLKACLGMILILVGGLIIIYRESQLARRQREMWLKDDI